MILQTLYKIIIIPLFINLGGENFKLYISFCETNISFSYCLTFRFADYIQHKENATLNTFTSI